MQKETGREINSKGEVKKETVKVYEVFPIAHREPVMKLISENGVPLAGERAAKEQKRVEEEFAKAEREQERTSNANKSGVPNVSRSRQRAAKKATMTR